MDRPFDEFRPRNQALEITGDDPAPFGSWIKIETRQIHLPADKQMQIQYVDFPDIVVVIGRVTNDDEDTVVLIRQFRHAMQGWIVEAPAGRVEPSESPEDTARRELKEETGFACESLKKLGELRVSPHLSNETTHVFLAEGLQPGPSRTMPGELIEVMEVPQGDVRAMVLAQQIVDSKTISALVLAKLV
jgi:ADP-ribose pyrophosphatase